MRFLHTADWHIGCLRRYPGSLERAARMLEEIRALAQRRRVDVIVVAGDLFDRSTPTHDERALVADFFRHAPVPIVAITGNHDRWGKELNQTALNWLIRVAPRMGHRVWDEPTTEWFEGAWWVAFPSGPWNQAEMNLLLQHQIAQLGSKTGPVIGLAHEFFLGAYTDSGYQGTKKETHVPQHDRVDYWALGDIHASQNLAPNAWYPGSPYQVDFGEKLPKGVLIVDTGQPAKPAFVELTSPKALVTLTEVPRRWPDAYVRLILRPEELPHSLPACVVETVSPTVEGASEEAQQEQRSLSQAGHVLHGMRSWFVEQGLTPKAQKRALRMVKNLVKGLHGTPHAEVSAQDL